MYTLILTVSFYVSSGGVGVVTTVPGFTSEAACVNAGNAYLKNMIGHADIHQVATLCVKL